MPRLQQRTRSRPRDARRAVFLMTVLAVLVVFVICRFVFPRAVENGIASFLIRPDPPRKSDLLFLLGGDYLLRAPYAAQLYREGYAPKILIAREPAPENGGGFTAETIALLKQRGVPADAIVAFSPAQGVTSTSDEARALRIYVDVYPVHSVLVVTSMLHTRRARLAIRRALGGEPIRVLVAGAGPANYSPAQWPQARQEMTKMIYYFFTFWG